jgi:hypothetical protein
LGQAVNNFNFDLLSQNLMQILQQCAGSSALCQYLQYDVVQPTLQPTIVTPSTLLNSKIFPMPFDEQIETEACSHLCIYYLIGNMKENMVITDTTVIFDVIVAKNL